MHNTAQKILIWLPSPMGDAILCTPALRALRKLFKTSEITFLSRPIVREVLSPCRFNDKWLELQNKNPFSIAAKIRKQNYDTAVLFKNSFGSALACFLAKVPTRIGYAREGRSFLLTKKLYPKKTSNGKFKPVSMLDYYLAIASELGGENVRRNIELSVEPKAKNSLKEKLPHAFKENGPIIILVPGGAFGPSKCWPVEGFAKTAEWLVKNHNATIVISVSEHPAEKEIARNIVKSCTERLINLTEHPLTISELKALFAQAELVISNDTGPRHIAIGLQRKIITLFGPTDPAWTETGYENEIKIIGRAPCAPCQKPRCRMERLYCMESITVERVCKAAGKMLEAKNPV